MSDLKQDFLRRISSRKFQVFILGFVVSTLFVYFSIIPPTVWADVLKWTMGIYVSGNGLEWISRSFGSPDSPDD